MLQHPRPLLCDNMDLGFDEEAEAEAVPEPAKARRVGDPKDEAALRKLLLAVTKLSLSSALRTRILQAAVMFTYVLPRESALVQQGYAATKQYHEKVQKLARDKRAAEMKQPHLHLFNSILKTIQSSLQLDRPADQEWKGDLEAFMAKVADGRPQPIEKLGFLGEVVKVCRLAKTKQRDRTRLEISFGMNHMCHDTLWMPVGHPWLVKQGAWFAEGVAPMGELEKDIQTQLNVLEGKARDHQYIPEHQAPFRK